MQNDLSEWTLGDAGVRFQEDYAKIVLNAPAETRQLRDGRPTRQGSVATCSRK
jgi:hypothetical protein